MGMGHYEQMLLTHLLPRMRECHPDWRFTLTYSGRDDGSALPDGPPFSNFDEIGFLGFSVERLLGLPLGLAQRAVSTRLGKPARGNAVLFHALSLGFPTPRAGASVISIHDAAPLRFSDEGTFPKWASSAARAANRVLTLSEFSKRELTECLNLNPARVEVALCGCEHEIFQPNVAPLNREELSTLGIEGAFVLYAGGSSARKNLGSLLEAWQNIRADYPQIVLALTGAPGAAQEKREQVIHLGHVPRATLPRLMKAARALIFPSTYEGFGLPPLEALALGVPVVAVNAGPMPEVVGEAGLLSPDGTPESLARSLRHVLDDETLRAEYSRRGPLQAQNFSWTSHAAQVLALYENILSKV